MKRIFVFFSVLLLLFFSGGCDRDRAAEETSATEHVLTREAEEDGAMAGAASTAVRAPVQYTLVYTVENNGTIEGDGLQTVSHGGSGAPVTAVPAPGHHFVQWSDGAGEVRRVETDVTSDREMTAIFAPNQYTLTYTAEGNGRIDGPCEQTVNHGETGSPVTAVPAAGYHFVSWSDGVASARRSDAGVSSDLGVKATFDLNRYNLSYTPGDHGTIEGAASQTVSHHGSGTLVTAVPEKGYHFAGWSDGVSEAARTDASVSRDISVTAEFAIDTYTVSGAVSGLAPENPFVLLLNDDEELTISADGRFTFLTPLLDEQSYEVAVLSHPSAPNQTCTVSRGAGTISAEEVTDIDVECTFVTYTIGGKVAGLPAGNQIALRNRKEEELVIHSDGDFVFAEALNDGDSYEVSIHNQQLDPEWFCAVENAAGTLAGEDVTDIDIACFPEAELQPISGNRKIDLQWNSLDFEGATFRLCRAKEDIAPLGFENCAELQGGVLLSSVSAPYTASNLSNEVSYWFQLEVRHPSGRRTFSNVVTATPVGGLNDTGIDWCIGADSNRSRDETRAEKAAYCQTLAATYPGQDARHGRDIPARANTLSKTGQGPAGFDITRICMSGEAAGEGKCPPNPSLGDGRHDWACNRDNVTGLMWEVKANSGLRNRSSTYSWYNPDEKNNGGEPGQRNGGSCTGSDCDTLSFIGAVNGTGLCGASDWRLPTRKELLSIVDNGRFGPAIDPVLFPNSPSSNFWSSSPYADQANSAWQVSSQTGETAPQVKNRSNHVRLVRMSGD